jgi:anti-sigma-K factor RskA
MRRYVPKAAVSNRSKRRSYSITSSARCWSCSGTSRPSTLARFDIDHQLVFRRRLHRKVSRLLALENAIGLWRIVTESLPFSSA